MQPNEYKFPTQMHQLNWLLLPSRLGKVSRKLLISATDGYFLANTKAGAFLTPLVFAGGLLWGWLHFGYQYVYTESYWFLLIAILIGSLSSHLGLFFSLGFIIGDFFFSGSHYVVHQGLTKHLALIISYIVLILITVVPAATIKYLVAEIKLPAAVPLLTQIAIAALLYATISYFYLFFWTKMAPVLIRPVFTWHDTQPSVQSIVVLQTKTKWLVWPGVGMAMLRVVFQSWMSLQPANKPFYTAIESHFLNVSSVKTYTSYINPWIKIFLYSCITALTLAGMLLNWKSGLIVGSLAFLFQALTVGLIPRPSWINKWAALVYKIPSLLRVVFAFVIIFFITRYVISSMWQNSNAFLPLIIPTCCAFLILFLLNPGKPANTSSYETNV